VQTLVRFSRVLVTLWLFLGVGLPAAAVTYPVGIKQIEEVDAHTGRHYPLAMFYPATEGVGSEAVAFRQPFFVGLHLQTDAPMAAGRRYPLVVLSHGRGSNPLYYAWFAQALAAHGYIVAGIYHFHANTYDSNVVYLANRLWQRPVDISASISLLLKDPQWAPVIDPRKIGVAGHSQGGFTALWIGGATVNREKYLAFQRGWKANQGVPASLRAQLPLDPEPALHVHDPRVKAVFSMAPGVLVPFGMDADGLRRLTVPAYITVGAGDTVTPPQENAVFAARYARHATLRVIAGRADHNVFVNECNRDGKDELPEACVDAPGVDRAAIHRDVAGAALKFFDANL
jgi:predicted dienelactone hydrolase